MTVDRELRTDRLLLRPFRLQDVDSVFAYHSDPPWAFFYPDPHPFERSDAEAMVAECESRDWEKQPTWAIEMNGEMIGEIGLSFDEERRRAELEFGIARRRWGNGFASEAATAVVQNAFRILLQLSRIYAVTDSGNSSARRVLEKVGMQFEGTMRRHFLVRGELFDLVIYGLLRSDSSKSSGLGG